MEKIVRLTVVVMAIDLVSWIAYFPAPYGFETRPILGLSPVFGLPFYVAFFLNLILIPILWKKPKLGSILTVLLGVLFIVGAVLDQAALAVPGLPPPPLVTVFQVEGAILSILLIVLGTRIYGMKTPEPVTNYGNTSTRSLSLARLKNCKVE